IAIASAHQRGCQQQQQAGEKRNGAQEPRFARIVKGQ
ncbi:MAG: hypothetical protein JWP43_3546, partial [Ramlibacter sp.]|nr:hypothetical protein [Ramlibacter sp.]